MQSPIDISVLNTKKVRGGEWNSAPPPKLLRLTIYGLQYSQIILKGVKFFDVNPESGELDLEIFPLPGLAKWVPR